MRISQVLLFLLLTIVSNSFAQEERISLTNPSFEDPSRPGRTPTGWLDCGSPYESPTDIQPGFFNVKKKAQNGNTYLGMVTRANETWEGISQRLSSPLIEGNCYQFRVYLSYTEDYYSMTRAGTNEFFNTPITLRIIAGKKYCDKKQVLAISKPISNEEWKEYTFKFNLEGTYDYIYLEAFYKTPTLLPYNGNILLDNISDIILMGNCEDEPDPILFEPKQLASKIEKKKKKKKKKTQKEEEEKTIIKEVKEEKEIIIKEQPKEQKKPEIMTVLADASKIEKGQTIRIEQLNFKADSTNIIDEMHQVLNEIYDFMKTNPNIKIEVGGHTNTRPPEYLCNQLSTARALSVAEYLIKKGIPRSRISHKGYGKTEPLDLSKTPQGRKKNQRVEIKIVSVK